MRVGIVCEGSTDDRVLRAVCREVLGADGLVLTLLQPDMDALRARAPGAGTGWQAVRAFLRQAGAGLAAATFDILVIQVDADLRLLPEIRKVLADSDSDALDALCDHVKSWIPGGVPESAVIALPRESIEAWLVAAATRMHDVEGLPKPVEDLCDAGLLERRDNGPYKDSKRYEALAAQLAPLLRDRRRLPKVPELERFAGKLAARANAVRKGARKRS